jgi:hypothetical protein
MGALLMGSEYVMAPFSAKEGLKRDTKMVFSTSALVDS